MAFGSADRLVVVSARLGSLSAVDRQVEAPGVSVVSAPLWTAEDIRAGATDASIVVLGAVEPFKAEVLASLPNLLAVVRRGVGYDNVDVDAATELGILVVNVPAASVEEVSDHALALCLALERRLVPLRDAVGSGRWAESPGLIQEIAGPCRRLSELTLGIVGLGRIGRALARKAQSVYATVVGHDPWVDDPSWPEGVGRVDLGDLLSTADHVSLHAPMSDASRHLIDGPALGSMKMGSILVNTARGGLVDEAALMGALSSGQLGGAALDVTEREPVLAGDPLLSRPESLILTGHAAVWGVQSQTDLRTLSMAAVAELLAGHLPVSVVNDALIGSPQLRLTNSRTGAPITRDP